MKTTALSDISSASLSELDAIPGDTYAVKNELKAMGAVWDKSERIWRIAPDKLVQARALVEHQALSLTSSSAGGGGIDLDTLADPFEQEGDGPRYAMLSEQDGNLYAAKDALKAIGASWDKNSRAWRVREERADYARAIVTSVTDDTKEAPSHSKTAKRAPALKPAPLSSGESVEVLEEKPEERCPKPTASPQKVAGKGVDEKGGGNTHETKVNEVKKPVQDGMMLGGLWRRRGADGKVYLSGWLSDTVEIRIVANEQRTEENDSSHQMYLVPIVSLSPAGKGNNQ